MSDEDLLRRLGETAREDVVLGEDEWTDPRWEALASGTLTPEEEKALGAEAGASVEGAGALEAFRPFAPGFEDRVLQRLRERQEEPEPAVQTAPTVVKPETVDRRFVFRQRWVVPLLAAASLAAVAVGWLQVGGFREKGQVSSWQGQIPAYALEISGVATMRSAERSVATLEEGKRFTLVLRPEREVTVPVEAYFFVRDPEGAWREWELASGAAESGPQGSVRVTGVLDSSLAPGRRPLAVAIGATETLPSVEGLLEILAVDGPVSSGEWTLVRQELAISAPEGSGGR